MFSHAPQLAPSADLTGAASTPHFVQFYEQDEYLLKAVTGYFSEALQAGETCVAIASESHRNGIEARLQACGFDLPTLIAGGQFFSLDAQTTLARFVMDGHVDGERCRSVIGDVLVRAGQRRRPVRVFGEMVALLCAEGHREAATRLEALWNELGKVYRFSLFCAYPLGGFTGEAHTEGFTDVGHEHSMVLPSESYTTLTSSAERLQSIAVLQQRAQSLELEVATRKQAEEEIRRLNTQLTEQLGEYARVVRQLEASQGELQERLRDLEVFHDVAVGRELKMIDLEKEVEILKTRLRP